MEPVLLYDTTLRDGTQGENINFTVEEKLRLLKNWMKSGFIILRADGLVPIPGIKNFLSLQKKLSLKMRG